MAVLDTAITIRGSGATVADTGDIITHGTDLGTVVTGAAIGEWDMDTIPVGPGAVAGMPPIIHIIIPIMVTMAIDIMDMRSDDGATTTTITLP